MREASKPTISPEFASGDQMDDTAYEIWESLKLMSYTGDQPDLRKQDVDAIAEFVRQLAHDRRRVREQLARFDWDREAMEVLNGGL